MAKLVHCTRCNGDKPGLEVAPYPGALGAQILDNACTECWAEWEKVEVMVINELRLNFMDPAAMDQLAHQLREFFFLTAPEASPEVGPESAPEAKPEPPAPSS